MGFALLITDSVLKLSILLRLRIEITPMEMLPRKVKVAFSPAAKAGPGPYSAKLKSSSKLIVFISRRSENSSFRLPPKRVIRCSNRL